jgi:ClpP class serine protease
VKRRRFGAAGGTRLFAIHPDAMQAFYEQQEVVPNTVANGVAVLTIDGPLEHKGAWWFDSYERIITRFKDALYSGEVRSVVLKIGSPGGDADGLNAHVDTMIKVKREVGKPVFCYADDEAYSAAYAIACVADEIYMPPGGGVGSIGVVARMMSLQGRYKKEGLDVRLVTSGKHKADGNYDAPITTMAEKHVLKRVMQLAQIYWELVSESRGIPVAEVRALEANTFYGTDGVRMGLADDIMSLDEVLTYAAKYRKPKAA